MLYKEFLGNLFRHGERSLGRAVFAAKCSIIARYPTDDNLYGPAVLWTLLGDPALRVRHRILTGVAEPSPKSEVRTPKLGVSISPNPCHRSTTIRLSSLLPTPHSLSVYDASGCLVYSQPVRHSSFVICTSSFPAGVYVARYVSGGRAAVARLVVER